MSRPDLIGLVDIHGTPRTHDIAALELTGGPPPYWAGWAEVPLRQPSARAQERARVAAVMAAPSTKRERRRKAAREQARETIRQYSSAVRKSLRERELFEQRPYQPRPADGPPAFRRACLRGLGRFLTGPSAELRRARVQWLAHLARTISEASS